LSDPDLSKRIFYIDKFS